MESLAAVIFSATLRQAKQGLSHVCFTGIKDQLLRFTSMVSSGSYHLFQPIVPGSYPEP